METPNMVSEVMEAVEEYFKDNEDVFVDCLLYLKGLYSGTQMSYQLFSAVTDKLEKMKRCPKCGEKLEWYHYQEPHDELDGCPMEDMYEPYCPNCDYPNQMIIRGV